MIKTVDNILEEKYALCKEHCEELHHIDRHPHLHCLVCGSVECLESVSISLLPMPKWHTGLEFNLAIKLNQGIRYE